jgi:hypothetical protein
MTDEELSQIESRREQYMKKYRFVPEELRQLIQDDLKALIDVARYGRKYVNPYTALPGDDPDIYSVKDFTDECVSRNFIDYDGFGNPMRDGRVNPDIIIKPSRLEEIPQDATHIIWYNR